MEKTKLSSLHIGIIEGLNEAEKNETAHKNELSFKIRTSTFNSHYITVGSWKESKLNVRLKNSSMSKFERVKMGEIANVIKDFFQDGDSVVIKCMPEIYNGKIRLVLSSIESTKHKLDFKDPYFKEETHEYADVKLEGVTVIKPYDGNTMTLGVIDYKNNVLPLDLKIDNYSKLRDYFKQFKEGEVIDSLLIGRRTVKTTTLMGRKVYPSDIEITDYMIVDI